MYRLRMVSPELTVDISPADDPCISWTWWGDCRATIYYRHTEPGLLWKSAITLIYLSLLTVFAYYGGKQLTGYKSIWKAYAQIISSSGAYTFLWAIVFSYGSDVESTIFGIEGMIIFLLCLFSQLLGFHLKRGSGSV